MSKTYDFLKQCGTFFLTTVNGNAPAARPFGAVMEYKGDLYFSTANTKAVYSQLISNPAIQIVALMSGTRDWIRINGKAIEVKDLHIKQAMLDSCPVLLSRFDSCECEYYALFKISEMESEMSTDSGTVKL